jgi:hypothetical protein
VARRSDGSQTSKRGFASGKAARDARRSSCVNAFRAFRRYARSRVGAGFRWRPGLFDRVSARLIAASTTSSASSGPAGSVLRAV